jgi:hypothetical protein
VTQDETLADSHEADSASETQEAAFWAEFYDQAQSSAFPQGGGS